MSLLFDTKTDMDGTPILYISSPLEDLGMIFGRIFNIYVVIFAVALGIISLTVIFKTSNTGLKKPAPTNNVNPNVRNDKAEHQRTWTNNDNTISADEYRYYGLQKTLYPKRKYYGLQHPNPPSSRKGFQPGLSNIPSPLRSSFGYKLTDFSTTFNGSYDSATNRCEAPFHLRTYYGCPKINDRSRSNYVPNNAHRFVNFGDLPTGTSQRRLERMRSVLI